MGNRRNRLLLPSGRTLRTRLWFEMNEQAKGSFRQQVGKLNEFVKGILGLLKNWVFSSERQLTRTNHPLCHPPIVFQVKKVLRAHVGTVANAPCLCRNKRELQKGQQELKWRRKTEGTQTDREKVPFWKKMLIPLEELPARTPEDFLNSAPRTPKKFRISKETELVIMRTPKFSLRVDAVNELSYIPHKSTINSEEVIEQLDNPFGPMNPENPAVENNPFLDLHSARRTDVAFTFGGKSAMGSDIEMDSPIKQATPAAFSMQSPLFSVNSLFSTPSEKNSLFSQPSSSTMASPISSASTTFSLGLVPKKLNK